MAVEKPQGATGADLAQLFDCTQRQVELLAKKGIVVRLGHGRYNAAASTRNYIRHLREQASGRLGRDPKVDGVAANVKWKETNTQLLHLRLRKEAGELVAVADVRETWGRIIRGIRQFVLALPGKIAFDRPMLTARDRAEIEQICRDGLEDAAMGRGFDVTIESSADESDVSDAETSGRIAQPVSAPT